MGLIKEYHVVFGLPLILFILGSVGYFQYNPFTMLLSSFFITFFVINRYNVHIYNPYFSPMRNMPTLYQGGLIKLSGKIGTDIPAHMAREGKSLKGGIFRYYSRFFFTEEVIVVNDPKILMEVLVTKDNVFTKPAKLRSFLGEFLGHEGLIVVEGDIHRRQKKALIPAFSHTRIKDLVPIFYNVSSKLINTWRTKIGNTKNGHVTLDVYDWLGRATLDMIGLAGFAYDFESISNPDNELAKLYHEVFVHRSSRLEGRFILIMSIVFGPFMLKLPFGFAAVARELKQKVIENTKKVITSAFEKGEVRRDIISIILQDAKKEGTGISETEAVSQCMTFLAAGHETTSTATTWAIWFLARAENEHIQTLLRQEIRSIWKDTSIPPTWDELESCKLLNNVVRETLRLVPPVPITLRESIQDTTLGTYFIPKGTIIFLAPSATNVDPQYWGPDADEFRPDRWNSLPVDFSNYSFLTFLHGARSCIGMKFSQTEMKLLLAQIVGEFKLMVTDESRVIEYASMVITRPKLERMNINVALAGE